MERWAAMKGFNHLESPLPCVDCGSITAKEVGGQVIYPHRPDLKEKRFWQCNCGAFVGCHPQSNRPLGAPAGPETRKARSAAHAVFDPLWQRKAQQGFKRHVARRAGYEWLASQMKIPVLDCHISYFSREQALQVIAICKSRKSGGRTCDAPMCPKCSHEPAEGKDLCPTHAAEWRARQAKREGV